MNKPPYNLYKETRVEKIKHIALYYKEYIDNILYRRGFIKRDEKKSEDEKDDTRTCAEYKEWRTACFKRDNYTCQITGQRGGNLVVHHKVAFHKIRKDRPMLYDQSNGITLTKEVHEEFHKEWGNKAFTVAQFNTFKDNYEL